MTLVLRSLAALGLAILAIVAAHLAVSQHTLRTDGEVSLGCSFGCGADALTASATLEFSAHDYASAGQFAAKAAQDEPIAPAAIGIAALSAEAQGDADRAEAIMRQAAQFGWRDENVQAWLFRTAASRNDWTTAAIRGDALLRTDPRNAQVLKALWLLASQPTAANAIGKQLAESPNWRDAFFYADGGQSTDQVRAFQAIVQALRGTSAPVTDDEASHHVRAMVDAGNYASARQVWLQTLPPAERAQGLISDPDFAHVAQATTPSPFDWQVHVTKGLSVVAQHVNGGHVLAIDTGPRARGRLVSQTLTLPPGTYNFNSSATGDVSKFGWRLDCLPGFMPLIRKGEMGAAATFVVPASNCRASAESGQGRARRRSRRAARVQCVRRDGSTCMASNSASVSRASSGSMRLNAKPT